MKQLLILLITLISVQAFSQSNLDSTSTWTYSFWNFGQIEPVSLYINGDTIINGINWYQLEGNGSCAFTNPDSLPYIREEDNKWLVYDVNRNSESTLYDFNLVADDSYTIEIFGPNYPILVNIDSTSERIINGVERIIQHINLVDFGLEIIEGIGCSTYLFPQGNICDPHTGPIRCFQNTIEFVDFDPDRDCDERYFPTNTNNISIEIDIQIFPNPVTVNNNVNFSSTVNIKEIEVFNSKGEIIIKQNNNNNSLEFTEPGLYFIKFSTKNNILIKRVVVTSKR